MKGLLFLLLSLMESDDLCSQVSTVTDELVRTICLTVQDDTPDVSQVNYPIAARRLYFNVFNKVLNSLDGFSGCDQFCIAVAPLIISHHDTDLFPAVTRHFVETEKAGRFRILAKLLPHHDYLVLCIDP